MIICVFGLYCNECQGSFQNSDQTPFAFELYSFTDVRQSAKELGWKRTKTGDICPSCAEEIKAKRAAEKAEEKRKPKA